MDFKETAQSEEVNANIVLKWITTFLTPEGVMPWPPMQIFTQFLCLLSQGQLKRLSPKEGSP